jgi:hypothetical protein
LSEGEALPLRALLSEHDLEAFDRGTVGLDDWLRRFARRAEAANTGRTFVWVEPGEE